MTRRALGAVLFCRQYCKALAEFVRMCRRWLREPTRQADPQYSYALAVRLAFLHTAHLGHGQVYDENARRLNPARKAAIRERDNGLCVQCGMPGVEVDHINGSPAEPSNLQLLCLDCHHTKTRQSMSQITDPRDQAAIPVLHSELAERINNLQPIRACDNEQTWGQAWRSWPNPSAEAMHYQEHSTALRFTDIVAAVSVAASTARTGAGSM